MALADDIFEVLGQMLDAGEMETRAGVVVTSPSQISTDPLTVQLDGSSIAVPVKQFRGFPVFPGMRVGLVRIGTDWVVIGAFTNPGTGTGAMRMAVGADTPPELKLFGVEIAFLFYVTKFETGVELGYFFMGLTNTVDGGNDEGTLFGSVLYPVPGDPSSAGQNDVKTHFQMSWDAESVNKWTIFKDASIQVTSGVPHFYLQTSAHFGHSIDTKSYTYENSVLTSTNAAKLEWNGSVAQPQTMVVLTRDAAQVIPHNVPTLIDWDAQEYGPSGLWDTVNNGVIAPYDGYYNVFGCFTVGSNTTGQRLIGLAFDGTLHPGIRLRITPATNQIELSLSCDSFYVNAGQVIGLMGYHVLSVAASLNYSAARMSVRLVNRTS